MNPCNALSQKSNPLWLGTKVRTWSGEPLLIRHWSRLRKKKSHILSFLDRRLPFSFSCSTAQMTTFYFSDTGIQEQLIGRVNLELSNRFHRPSNQQTQYNLSSQFYSSRKKLLARFSCLGKQCAVNSCFTLTHLPIFGLKWVIFLFLSHMWMLHSETRIRALAKGIWAQAGSHGAILKNLYSGGMTSCQQWAFLSLTTQMFCKVARQMHPNMSWQMGMGVSCSFPPPSFFCV